MKEQLQRIIDNMQAELNDNQANADQFTGNGYYQLQGRISALENYIQDLQQLMQQFS